MKCTEFLRELTDYLDDNIDTATRVELEEHLQWCRNCYVVCNTTKMTIEIYRNNEIYELPNPLRSKLQNAIISKCKGKRGDPEA